MGKYFVYAIYSDLRDYMYIGMTNNVDRRLLEHNKGYNKTTKPYLPFRLIYTEVHDSRSEARLREKYFKGGSGRKFLRNFIKEEKS